MAFLAQKHMISLSFQCFYMINLPDLLKFVVKSSQFGIHEKDTQARHLILEHGLGANIQCIHLPL